MALRDKVRILISEGKTLQEAIDVCRSEDPKLKPYRVREAYNILTGGGLVRDKRSIENETKPRRLEDIWNSLRQREASHAEDIRKAITLPKLKFMEKEFAED